MVLHGFSAKPLCPRAKLIAYMTANSVSQDRIARASGTIVELLSKTSLLDPVDAVPFREHSSRRETRRHTDMRVLIWPHIEILFF